jgi:hypothetical protein
MLKRDSLDVTSLCGASAKGKIETTSVEQPDVLYKAMSCVLVLAQALLPLLRLRPGQIVFTSSSQDGQGALPPLRCWSLGPVRPQLF